MHMPVKPSRKAARPSTRPSASVRSQRPRVPITDQEESDSLLKVEGVVTSMVRILEHFTVRDRENNKFIRLTWTPQTRFTRKGKSAAPTALRIGQPVRVSCDLADKGGLLAEVVAISS